MNPRRQQRRQPVVLPECSDDVVRRDLTRCLRHDDCDVVFVGIAELPSDGQDIIVIGQRELPDRRCTISLRVRRQARFVVRNPVASIRRRASSTFGDIELGFEDGADSRETEVHDDGHRLGECLGSLGARHLRCCAHDRLDGAVDDLK